jgi:hypothetical protein
LDVLVAMHALGQLPPQSTPVSSPSWIASAQEAETDLVAAVEHADTGPAIPRSANIP